MSKHPKPPDFTESEFWVVQNTLNERYRERAKDIEIMGADSEIRLYPDDRELTEVACLVWQVDDCTFVIFKTGEELFRNQFFYRIHYQYSTGVYEYDNIGDCVVSLLQVQADHEAKRTTTS
jgi:hypothetical protein